MIRRATVSVPVRATREAAWALLTDHEQSVAWLPGITEPRVLTSEGDISVVEITFNHQPLALEIVASPPHGVRFEQVDQWGAEGISGGWTLRDDVADGLLLETEIRAPTPWYALGSRLRMREALKRATTTVAKHLERPPTAQLSTYRRALAIVRRGNIIEARIGDQVVELIDLGGGG